MNRERHHNLIPSNGNQEWGRRSHAGGEVDTFDSQVRHEVGPGGHEQPDGSAGLFANGVLSRPYHRQALGRGRFAGDKMPITHVTAIVDRYFEASLMVGELDDVGTDLLAF